MKLLYTKTIITDIKPISTNEMYFSVPKKCTKYKKNGEKYTFNWATHARTPKMKNYQLAMGLVLNREISNKDVLEIKEIVGKNNINNRIIKLRISHITNQSNYNDYDVSNTIKAFEDCLVKRIGIDDRYTGSVEVEKLVNNAMNTWGTIANYSIYER